MNFRASAAVLVLTAVPMIACGPDKPADAPPTTNGTAAIPTAPSTAPSTAASMTAPLPSPGDAARFAAVKAAPAAAPIAGAKADDPLGHGLVDTANWLSPGLAPDGAYYKATLTEHGRAHADVSLKAGKCYALIGFANLATIIDYDLILWKSSGAKASEDDDDDSTPTIGKTPICPTEDTAYVVEMFADHGAGDAAFQLFTKAK